MNIGIFEEGHFEVTYPLLKICDKPNHRITVFVNETTYKHLKDLLGEDIGKYQWVIQPNHVSIRKFIKVIYDACKKNNIELLFLNTVSNNYIFYALLAKKLHFTKVIVTIHDANSFLRSSFSLNVKRSLRHIGKKMLAHYVYAFNTLAENVRDYISNNIVVKKKLFCIPGAVYEGRQNSTEPMNFVIPLRIVVPGSIDWRRRDYEFVFSLLQQINQQCLPVHITLLGGGWGEYRQKILEKCKLYCEKHENLTYYTGEIVCQHEYDRQLDNCHFIFIPSIIKTIITDNIEETYGLTKSSGSIFDAVKHAKPIIIPAALRINADLESGVIKYNNIEELLTLLRTMINQPENYQQIAANAFNNSKEYTVEKCREKISDLL